MSQIDLHMHSIVSNDGEYTPQKLIKMGHERSVRVMSLTDHNSIRGILEAEKYAKKLGIHFIPGIEIDCTFEDVDLHLLGYGINPEFKEFHDIEKDILKQEQQASKKRIELVKRQGIVFDSTEAMKLSKDGCITGEMIAEVALENKVNRTHPLMIPFYEGGSRSDAPYVNFYWDICSKGKVAYVPVKYISLVKAIDVIHAAGGISVLAHPGKSIKEDDELLNRIINKGIDGIEVYSSYHSHQQTQFYMKQAEKYSLLKTVGSDFHGKTKPTIKIGSVECNNQEEKIYHSLIEKLKNLKANSDKITLDK